jgi:AraC-like DNA-binding protein
MTTSYVRYPASGGKVKGDHMAAQLTVEQRLLARRLRDRGLKLNAIARLIGCHENVVYRLFKWLFGFQRGLMVASRSQLGFPA